MNPRTAPTGVRAVLEEERDFFLRSLRDLEAEHTAGDIDDTDYRSLRTDYTARAAAVLRRLRQLDEPAPAPPPAPIPSADRGRWWRRPRRVVLVGTALAAVVAGGTWVLASSTANRQPGGAVTGQAVGPEKVAALLQSSQKAAARGDGVGALRDLDAILAENPNQVQALAAKGWILVQTRQPNLAAQGIGLLGRAVDLDPTYPVARLYRGVAYLASANPAAAAPDLQWYLDHAPDPALVGKVRQALAQARAALDPATAPATPGATTNPSAGTLGG